MSTESMSAHDHIVIVCRHIRTTFGHDEPARPQIWHDSGEPDGGTLGILWFSRLIEDLLLNRIPDYQTQLEGKLPSQNAVRTFDDLLPDPVCPTNESLHGSLSVGVLAHLLRFSGISSMTS
jgi:hypothetical protein